LPGLDIATLLANINPATNAGIGGYPNLNANFFNRYSYYFRKYDQADRDQQILNVRLNYLARDDLDLGATVQLKNVKYPDSFYGLEKDNQDSFSLDLNYQPSAAEQLYAYYSFQKAKKSMSMNSGVASAVNTACTMANLALYGYSACSDGIGNNGGRPFTSAWTSDTDDRNDVLGLGFQKDLGRVKLGIDYTYSSSKTDISYRYGSTALSNVAATQLAVAAFAGSALPSMTFVQHTLSLNVLVPIDRRTSVRLFDRYEVGRVKDWHYDNVITNAVAAYDNSTLLLDSGPQHYHVNVIGVFLQYKL